MATAKYKKNYRGIYETKIWDGTFTPDGAKHRVRLTSTKSSKDLERKVNEYTRQRDEGNTKRYSDITFQEYAREWLDTKKSMREKNTIKMYKNIIEVHFAFLEDTRLSDIRNSHFQQAITNAIKKPSTCKQIYMTFKQVLRMALADNLISEMDMKLICMDISLPKHTRAKKRALTQIEKDSLKKCFDSNIFTEKERSFLTIILNCGLRKGETLALTRFDFKFLKNGASVSINKTLIFDGNNPEIKNYPKTENGIREVPIPKYAAEYLQKYISRLPGTNLFYSSNSSLITKSSYDKMWISIINKMNTAAGGTKSFPMITGLTAHIFRHNYCSNLCYKVPQISIKKIAQLMGDTQKVVLDIYDHIIEEKENVNEVLDDVFAM